MIALAPYHTSQAKERELLGQLAQAQSDLQRTQSDLQRAQSELRGVCGRGTLGATGADTARRRSPLQVQRGRGPGTAASTGGDGLD